MKDKYLKILGLNTTASLNDIKEAYRSKAKKLHPDINPSPNAHNEFIELNEAFEYLQNLKTGKVYHARNRKHSHPRQAPMSEEEWQDKQREKARARARYYAKMRYRQYVQSDHYKNAVAVNVLADFMGVAFVLLMILGAPIVSYWAYGFQGLYLGGTVAILFLIFATTVGLPKLKFERFWPSLRRLSQIADFHFYYLLILNVYIFFSVALNTMLNFNLLLTLYFVSMAMGYGLCFVKDWKSRRKLFTFGFAPGFLSLILCLNYYFSTGPAETETYNFKFHKQRAGRNRVQESTLIYLENDAYEKYPGLRVFFNYSAMAGKRKVIYHFEEGLLGIKVLKDYEFLKGT